MKTFRHVIADPVGIHLRNIAPLVGKVKEFPGCEVTIERDGRSANLLRTSAVLRLAVKCGDAIVVSVNGGEEESAAAALEAFFKANL